MRVLPARPVLTACCESTCFNHPSRTPQQLTSILCRSIHWLPALLAIPQLYPGPCPPQETSATIRVRVIFPFNLEQTPLCFPYKFKHPPIQIQPMHLPRSHLETVVDWSTAPLTSSLLALPLRTSRVFFARPTRNTFNYSQFAILLFTLDKHPNISS